MSKFREKHKSLFESADKLLDYSFDSISNVERVGRNRTSDTIQAVFALYVKSTRLYKGSLLLAEQGLAQECMALTRIAFEALLYMLWIDKEDDDGIRSDRSRDLLGWQVVTRNKLINKLLDEAGPIDNRTEETANRLKPYLEKLKLTMKTDEWDNFVKYGPFRTYTRIEDLAKNVSQVPAYNRIYKIGSEIIHCQDLLEYTEKNPETASFILKGYDDKFVKAALGQAIIIQFCILTLTSRLLRLDLREKLRILNATLRSQYAEFAELYPNGWDGAS